MDKVNLLDICNPKQWKTLATSELIADGKYDVYGANGIIGKYDDYNHEKSTVLITCRGATCGNVHLSKPFSYINGNAMSLDNLDESRCLKEYLYYYLKGIDLSNSISGSAQPQITIQGLKKINVSLYDIKQQRQIVNILSKIENLITYKKDEIEKANQLIKSQFVEMFGDFNNSKYKKTKLDKIANIGSSHRVFTNEFVDNGIPFYRGTEITMLANGVKPKECFYISKEHYEKICSDKTKPKINDLLMPSICDKGQIWLVNTDEPFYYKDGRVLSISLKTSNINPKYLHYYMKNKTIEEYPKLGSGSTFAEFKIFLLKDVDVIVPPIELQNKFANIAEQIDKQKFEFEKSLKKLEELQASLMQEYFG